MNLKIMTNIFCSNFLPCIFAWSSFLPSCGTLWFVLAGTNQIFWKNPSLILNCALWRPLMATIISDEFDGHQDPEESRISRQNTGIMADQNNTDGKGKFYSEILRCVFTFNGTCERACSQGSGTLSCVLPQRLFVIESLWTELSDFFCTW